MSLRANASTAPGAKRDPEPVAAMKDGEPSENTPTTKRALGDTAPQRPLDAPGAVPKGFMASTWHENTSRLKLLRQNPLKAILYDLMYRGPHTIKKGKLPVHGSLAQNLFIFPRTLPPMIYQWYCMKYRGEVWSLGWAMTVYIIYFVLFSKMALSHFNRLVAKYGTLDNNTPRDKIPDIRLMSTAIALIAYAAVRPVVGVLLTFNAHEVPHLTWWLPVHMFCFTTLLDFYFYWYHRAMHEVDWLWRFHKTHHMTKHPSSILSAFADTEQDFFDIFVIPALTLMTYRVDFFTWWVCQVYILFIEASGHSGIRMFIQSPITSPILQYFGMDLALEDHDLHHRNGWRKSANYGKQTRVWDRLFGTTRDRVECVDENIDWSNRGSAEDWLW